MPKAWLWGLSGAALALVSCDQPVESNTPVPPGHIEVQSALPQSPADVGIGIGNVVIICTKDTDCSPPLNPCTAAKCDLVLGCTIVDADGIPCDDGNPCTGQGTCKQGTCDAGPPITCAPLDQCHTAGACDPTTGQCSNPPAPNGTTCNDNNACTRADACQNGVCSGGNSVGCTALDQCHLAGTCNPSTGVCSNPNQPNGMACNDNNACTRTDSCQNGVCAGGNPVTCTALDQCHTVGTCNTSTGTCSNPNQPNGMACNDGNACTRTDTCQNGACSGGNPVVCTALDQCHLAGTCNTSTGICSNPNRANGDTCTDLSVCTTGDKCMNGVCQGTPKVCAPPDQCHDPATCDGVTGNCVYAAKPAGTMCNDMMLCTWGDKCTSAGACAGTPITCVSDESAIRECDGTQTCKVTPRPGAACDDHNPCTRGDVLDANGMNCAGMPYTCQPSQCVMSTACDGNGGCLNVNKPDATSCDADGSKCTPMDRCQAGVCVRDPKPVACVTKDCNTVACNPATGDCDYQPTSGGTCGVTGCFTMGTCSNGICSGTPRDCSMFDSPCSTGLCEATTGGCVAAHRPNGTSCDPGGMCATGAVCAFGTCELAPTGCPPAGGTCKLATCEPSTGRCGEEDKPAGTVCDPMTPCLNAGACDDQGRCIGSPTPNGEPCTAAGGAIGLCISGSCVSLDGGAGTRDGGPGSDDGKSGCGCALAARPGRGAALALAAAGLLLPRRKRRPPRR